MATQSPDLPIRLEQAPPTGALRPARSVLSSQERQLLFFSLDLLLIPCATAVAAYAFHMYARLVLPTTLLFVACLLLARFYEPGWPRQPRDILWRATPAAGLALALWGLLCWWYALPASLWAPAALCVVAAWLFVLGWRLALFPWLVAQPLRTMLMVGVGPQACGLVSELHATGAGGYRVLGFVDDDPVKQRRTYAGLPVLGTTSKLAALAESLGVQAVAVQSMKFPQKNVLLDCIEQGTDILTFSELYEELASRVGIPYIDADWFVQEFRTAPGHLYLFSKRAVDLAIALAGLLATALLFLPIALAIKLGGGPGPILFSQARVGYRGRIFQMYKFRTMRQDAEKEGAVWASQNDCRVTNVGRVLRQTRLDELPQFWNVLRGEMSMVGPRPERPEFVGMLAEEIPFYKQRQMVKPGVSGWAQINFPYGASVEDSLQKLQYDLFYIKHRSLRLDLQVLLRTLGVMVKKIGAR